MLQTIKKSINMYDFWGNLFVGLIILFIGGLFTLAYDNRNNIILFLKRLKLKLFPIRFNVQAKVGLARGLRILPLQPCDLQVEFEPMCM